jgi:hypothetical protein
VGPDLNKLCQVEATSASFQSKTFETYSPIGDSVPRSCIASVQKELDRVGIQIRTQAELKMATELATERKYWSEQVIDKYVECRMNEFKAEMATRKAARQDNASQVAVNSQE